ncbi:hypothetical protein DXX93_18120 [Thalassotalea euphylliae]|uniref:Uncharacterized protein n=1 Tax=Thalassotalea euphylliae TaxID=1655234 RepID=A0A3E0TV14_9GAMM|nr:hypothetical protein DXX93_18120 [Thalassotalea euphylliae]
MGVARVISQHNTATQLAQAKKGRHITVNTSCNHQKVRVFCMQFVRGGQRVQQRWVFEQYQGAFCLLN